MSEKKTERYSLISVYSRSSKSTISMLRVKEIKILFFVGKFYSKRSNYHMMISAYIQEFGFLYLVPFFLLSFFHTLNSSFTFTVQFNLIIPFILFATKFLSIYLFIYLFITSVKSTRKETQVFLLFFFYRL